MKAAKTITPAVQHNSSHSNQPFFKKEGKGSFFDQHQAKGDHFFGPSTVQPKLKIGQPNDKYEVEADSMADKVVNKLSNASVETTAPSSVNSSSAVQPKSADSDQAENVQKKEGEGLTEGTEAVQKKPIFESNAAPSDESVQPKLMTVAPLVQRKCSACEEKEKLQKKEEETPEADSELQLKPIFESGAPPPDESIQAKLSDSPFSIQAKCPSCDSSYMTNTEEDLQTKEEEVSDNDMDLVMKPLFDTAPDPPSDNQTIQTKSDSPTTASSGLQSSLNSSKGSGQPMSPDTQSSMSDAFGADFSGVRIHTGNDAVQMNKELGAQAFTHGSDIYFNEGKYDTSSSSGKHLLAHELTHTVQQGASIRKKPAIQRSEEEDLKKELESADRDQVEAIDPVPAEESKVKATEESQQAEKVAAEKAAEKSEKEAKDAKAKAKDLPKEGKKAKPKAKKSKADKVKPSGGADEPKGAAGEFLDQESAGVCNDGAKKAQQLADNEQTHDDAGQKLKQTEDAVVPPAQEGQSRSNAGQVDAVDGMPEPTPNAAETEAEFDKAVEESVPSDIDELNEFESEGKAKVVGNKVLESTSQEVGAVQGTYSEIENAPEAAPPPTPDALPEIETAPDTAALNIGKDAVPELAEEHTDFSEFENQSTELQEKEGISDEQLEMVDKGDLAKANEEKKGLKKKVDEEPNKIKSFAKGKQKKVDQDLKQEEKNQKKAMKAKRDEDLKKANKKQNETKSAIEIKREKVTKHINGIYEKAKSKVTVRLENLETEALKSFDLGQARLSKTFEREVKRDVNAWKRERYSGFWGGVKWAKDKLFGIADFPEVQSAFDRARERYINRIDQLIVKITKDNNKVIQECKEELTKAKAEIKEYVDGLGPELRKTGEAAQKDMQAKLAEMDEFINKKKEELQQKLCDKKEEAIKAIDEKIESMKSKMSGALSILGALLLEAAKKFFTWAIEGMGGDPKPVLNILDKGAAVIKAIFTDPLGFFGNLGKAVGGGINGFVNNIGTHLKTGLIGWLTGAMGDSGLQLPEKFDMKGIMSLGLQVAGLTWTNIRGRIVKKLGPKGEKMMSMAESGVEIVKKVITEGPIALWNMIKEQAASFKEKAMTGIKDWIITTIVKKASLKLLSMLNPVGAIVQAIIAVYDLVMFFVENWQRILDFVNSIFDSVSSIAQGAVGKASAFIEKSLAMTIPIIISFLARFIGLGGIGKAIKKIIKKIQKPIKKVLDKIIGFIVKKVKKLFGKGGGKKGKDMDNDPKKAAKISAGLGDINKEEKKYLTGGNISKEEAKKVAKTVKGKHKVFKSIKVKDSGKKWDYIYKQKEHSTPSKKEEGGDLAATYKAEIDKLDSDVKVIILAGLKKNEAKLKDAKNWNDLIERLKKLSGTNALFLSPMNKSHKFGKAVQTGQGARAFDSALAKVVKSEEKKKKLVADKANWIDKRAPILAGERTDKAKHAKDGLIGQIVNGKSKGHATSKIRLYFEESMSGASGPEEHGKYEPLNVKVHARNKKIVITYSYKVEIGGKMETRMFSSTLALVNSADGPEVVQKVIGRKLVIKKPKTRGKTESVNQVDANEKMQKAGKTKENLAYDASHVLADLFLGSGYRSGLNLITTSADYNRKTMKTAEESLKRKVVGFENGVKSRLGNDHYVTFNLSVKAKWKPILDSKIVGELAKANPKMSQKDKDASHKILAADNDPKLVKEVFYKVVGVNVMNGLGQKVKTERPKIFEIIGEDTSLNDILIK